MFFQKLQTEEVVLSLYMNFCSVPDHHIDFLKNHPQYVSDYLDGKLPVAKGGFLSRLFKFNNTNELPPDWPTDLTIHSTEINHNQVEYFHYLLNGTESSVANSGCLFQTWFNPGQDSCAIAIDDTSFAFISRHVRELSTLLSSVSNNTLFTRYKEKVDENMSDDDKEFLQNSFDEIRNVCIESLRNNNGLIWFAT